MSWLFLERPIHVNHFEKKFSIPEDELCNFMISVDGGIQAVNAAVMGGVLADPEVQAIRAGYKKAPRHIFISDMPVLLKTCAIMLEVDENIPDVDDSEDEDEEG